jgi:hypothetical protein
VKPIIKCPDTIDYEYVIVAGYPGNKTFTLSNSSEVEVPIIIDLR